MLRISKLTDYAILVMVELCREPTCVLNAQVLAERSHLELPTVSKVMKMLAGSGLVCSYRGSNGGYRVELSPEHISVAQVITAIEGPIAMTECSVHEGLCSVEANCSSRDNLQKISQVVAGALDGITLADMVGGSAGSVHAIPGLNIATVSA